jgi:phenylpropionate dioxygenase-like ring-hydroxylating dioxygenase large terminal subunit
MLEGWYQIAYERELLGELTPASAGNHTLMIVKSGGEISTFDSICPHMGTNLAIGGILGEGHIVCPFHNFKIGLGKNEGSQFWVTEYPTLVAGGMVFAFFSNRKIEINPFRSFITGLDQKVFFVPGIKMEILTNFTNVTENAFDSNHFQPIHRVLNTPQLKRVVADRSTLKMTGVFNLPSSPWYASALKGEILQIPYTPQAYSPGLVVSHMGGNPQYWVITSSLPHGSAGSIVYVSIGVYADSNGKQPEEDLLRYMLERMRANLKLDAQIWENMPAERPFTPTANDNGVVAFREYCLQFNPL